MDETSEKHGDGCGCLTCKRARKAAYMREYTRQRAESDPTWIARRSAKAHAAQRERMGADPDYAAHVHTRRNNNAHERRDRDPEGYRAHLAALERHRRVAHRDELNTKARAHWHRHPEYRELQRDKWREWRAQATPEDLEQKRADERARSPRYRERRRINGKLWRERNRERAAALRAISNANRRARLLAAPGTWTREQFQDLCYLMGNHCYYCGCVSEKLTADHAIPLSRGGTNDITNLVPACLSCNKRKGARSLDEYVARLMEEPNRV